MDSALELLVLDVGVLEQALNGLHLVSDRPLGRSKRDMFHDKRLMEKGDL